MASILCSGAWPSRATISPIPRRSSPSNILKTGVRLRCSNASGGEVVLTHDENNEHRCTGCSACEVACPNGTIEIISKKEEIDGKPRKVIDKFVYHLQMCTFCNLCILSCPTDAIKMSQDFEHAVFDRSKLTKVLNKPGSKLVEGVR